MIFLFMKIHHPALFEELGSPEADHILACQYFLIEDILQTHGVFWTKRSAQGVLSIFTEGEPAQAAVALRKEFQDHIWNRFGKAQVAVVLHVGEADALGQNYMGPDFNHALQLLDAAWGGQILLTVPAVHFVPLPPGLGLRDLGSHLLKDLSPPSPVFALRLGEPEEGPKPSLRSLQTYPQNFIPQASPFFGREEEIIEIGRMFRDPAIRLVTLRGPGGFGKTRLALQAAAEQVDFFKDGVFTVALAPLLTEPLIVGAIANAIKFFFHGGEETEAQLFQHLKAKEMLLILDNFEHLIEGARLVEALLGAAPGVKALVTSREGLKIRSEKIFDVRGLRFPEKEDLSNPESFSSVQLFLRSARRVKPDFRPDSPELGAIAKICRLLEGMPLGIELSATWVPHLKVGQIAEKIEDGHDFLATTMPHLPARHRSLRAVFEYSWILLSEPQKKVLEAISVFRGGFRLESAGKVAGATEAVLKALVQKSLVHRGSDGRFEIHELLKYYAKEKLFDDPREKERALDSHSVYFGRLLDKKGPGLFGPGQKQVLQELVEEIGNIREGWNRAVEKNNIRDMGLYLDALFTIYDTKGWFGQARDLFQSAAEKLRRVPNPSRAAMVLWARILSRWAAFENALGSPRKAGELYEESLRLFKKASATRFSGFALSGLGIVVQNQGHYRQAHGFYKKSLAAFRSVKDPMGVAWALNHLGQIEIHEGRPVQARGFIERSLASSEKVRDRRSMGYSYNLLGDILQDSGNPWEAKAFYQKGLEAYLDGSDRKGLAWSFANLGRVAEAMGDYSGARQMFRESLVISRDLGDLRAMAWLENLSGKVSLSLGEREDSARRYEKGLELYRKVEDARGTAWTFNLKAEHELSGGNWRDAEKFFDEAREILLKEEPDSSEEAWYLHHLGLIDLASGKFSQAEAWFLKGLGQFLKLKDLPGQAISWVQMGESANRRKSLFESEKYFRKAAGLALRCRRDSWLVEAAAGAAKVWAQQGEERKALGFLTLALSDRACRHSTKIKHEDFARELELKFTREEKESLEQWARGNSLDKVAATWAFPVGRAGLKKHPSDKRKTKARLTKKKARRTGRKTRPKP